jgi:FKBP-type peptidyl-prolyl cis-trans isomerase
MNRIFVVATLLTLTCGLGAMAQDGAAAPAAPAGEKSAVVLQNDVDKTSYVVGMQIGKSIAEGGIEMNSAIVAAGIDDAMKNRQPAIDDKQMMEVNAKLREQIQAKRTETMQKQQEKAKVEGDKNIKAAEDFLAENGKKEGIKTTASGLQYQVLTEGIGASPKPTDEVTVHYKGTLLDGSTFDSSYDRNEPATFQVDKLIPGWVEALQLMKEGGKYKLFIHPKLAYGERAAGQIPPNSMLIFEMEMIKIKAGSPSVEIKAPDAAKAQ